MIIEGSVSEWLRRRTRNPLGTARVGSNPAAVVSLRPCGLFRTLTKVLHIPLYSVFFDKF